MKTNNEKDERTSRNVVDEMPEGGARLGVTVEWESGPGESLRVTRSGAIATEGGLGDTARGLLEGCLGSFVWEDADEATDEVDASAGESREAARTVALGRLREIDPPGGGRRFPKLAECVCAVDLETSGVDPMKHGVLSMGAVMLKFGEVTADFQCEVRLPPDLLFDGAVTDINGYTAGDAVALERTLGRVTVSTRRTAGAVRAFFAWLDENRNTGGKVYLCGQNVGSFDAAFLKRMAERARVMPLYEERIHHRTLDLHAMLAAMELAGLVELPEGCVAWDSRAIWTVAGLGEEPKPHQAMFGAWRTAAAWQWIVARCRRDS